MQSHRGDPVHIFTWVDQFCRSLKWTKIWCFCQRDLCRRDFFPPSKMQDGWQNELQTARPIYGVLASKYIQTNHQQTPITSTLPSHPQHHLTCMGRHPAARARTLSRSGWKKASLPLAAQSAICCRTIDLGTLLPPIWQGKQWIRSS